MKQPKVLIDGVLHNVASIWWQEDGEMNHIAYHLGESVYLVFGSEEYLNSILIKEEKNNEPITSS